MGVEKSKRNSVLPVAPRSPGNIKVSPAVFACLILVFHALRLCSAVKLINGLVMPASLSIDEIHLLEIDEGDQI